jgi:hypothetical protein
VAWHLIITKSVRLLRKLARRYDLEEIFDVTQFGFKNFDIKATKNILVFVVSCCNVRVSVNRSNCPAVFFYVVWVVNNELCRLTLHWRWGLNINYCPVRGFVFVVTLSGRSQWSAAVRFLGLRVRILPRAWMRVSYECCVLSGRVLCVGLMTRPEESRECDNEFSIMRRPWPTGAVAPW